MPLSLTYWVVSVFSKPISSNRERINSSNFCGGILNKCLRKSWRTFLLMASILLFQPGRRVDFQGKSAFLIAAAKTRICIQGIGIQQSAHGGVGRFPGGFKQAGFNSLISDGVVMQGVPEDFRIS